jgi:hypothetical protein
LVPASHEGSPVQRRRAGLSADSLKVGQDMFLAGSYTTTAGDLAINLQSARIRGTLSFVPISPDPEG